MFTVQKCYDSLQIYIYYDEYIGKDEDESIPTLEHLFSVYDTSKFEGVIDLITVKKLSSDEIIKIEEIHEILKKSNIKNLNVISDSKRVLGCIKGIMPDVSVTLLKV